MNYANPGTIQCFLPILPLKKFHRTNSISQKAADLMALVGWIKEMYETREKTKLRTNTVEIDLRNKPNFLSQKNIIERRRSFMPNKLVSLFYQSLCLAPSHDVLSSTDGLREIPYLDERFRIRMD